MTITSKSALQTEANTHFSSIYSTEYAAMNGNHHNNEVDAYRHAYASAVLAYEIGGATGQAVATAVGWLSETVETIQRSPYDKPGQPTAAEESAMDNYNNSIGVAIAAGLDPDDPDYKEHTLRL